MFDKLEKKGGGGDKPYPERENPTEILSEPLLDSYFPVDLWAPEGRVFRALRETP